MNLKGASHLEITVKDENGDLLADSDNVLNTWKCYFSQLLNVHNANDVKADRSTYSSTTNVWSKSY
jgi:hypothetical protein